MNPPLARDQLVADWIELFTRLGVDGVPSLQRLSELASDDVRFRDPFNDARGREALHRILAHTREQVRDLDFRVKDVSDSDTATYLKWVMLGRVKWLGPWRVEGVSELRFADDGRINAHLDHWDAAGQFYDRLPIIGWCLRRLAARARAS